MTRSTNFVGSEVEWLRYLLANICICYNYVKQLLNNEIISLNYVRLEMNLVDPLTKPLSKKLARNTLRGMKLMPDSRIQSDGNPTSI